MSEKDNSHNKSISDLSKQRLFTRRALEDLQEEKRLREQTQDGFDDYLDDE